MNPRLKELAKQSGIYFGGHPMNPLSVYPSELQKFAELIIQEYCDNPLEIKRRFPTQHCEGKNND
jgi:hypothetical protein